MKAAILVKPLIYQYLEVPEPDVPRDGLLLKVSTCGVCGSDLRRWKEGPVPGSQGVIGGHEVAGVVIATGPDVSGHRVGDRLAIAPDIHCGKCYFCSRGLFNLCDDLHLIGISEGYPGGFAEKMALSGQVLHNGIVHPVPESMPDVCASLAEPLSSVLAAHEKAQTGTNQVVVVMGAGPIGCLHTVVAHLLGARVIVSEPNPTRRQLARTFEPEAILNPAEDDIVASIRETTSGLGADIAVCANPVAATHTQALELVRKGGKVVLFGGLPKENPMTLLDANRIHYGEVEVMGSFSYLPVFHQKALQLIQRGSIPVEKLITHTFSLLDIQQAFSVAASGEALKVMIRLPEG